VGGGRIYSVGYEGFDVGALAERLAQAKVSVLVDVRLNAVSRRAGFSKNLLREEMARVGIAYIHEPELGNPVDNRERFRRGDEHGREVMRSLLADGSGEALERLMALARGSRVAVLCVERDRRRCHRDVITDVISERDPSIEVLQVL
jgi:uncharacterized protein (DUF488 family)